MFQFEMQGTPSMERRPRKVYRQVLIFEKTHQENTLLKTEEDTNITNV